MWGGHPAFSRGKTQKSFAAHLGGGVAIVTVHPCCCHTTQAWCERFQWWMNLQLVFCITKDTKNDQLALCDLERSHIYKDTELQSDALW